MNSKQLSEKMDPVLTLPLCISEEILSYLPGKDLLNASLVSKSWYQCIGNTPSCMKKINLIFKDFKVRCEKPNCRLDDSLCCTHESNFNAVLESTRQYQSVMFSYYQDDTKIFEQRMQLIVKKFAGSIQNIFSTLDIQQIDDLPNLKVVNFAFFCFKESSVLKDGLMKNAGKIEKLTLRRIHMFPYKTFNIIFHLKRMARLKSFSFDDEKFLADCSSYPFQLEEVANTARKLDSPTVPIEFMLSHSATLKSIQYDYPTDEILRQLLTRFPQVHTLKIASFDRTSTKYPLNQQITCLVLTGVRYDYTIASHLKGLLECLPNLQELKVSELTTPILHIIHLHRIIEKVSYLHLSSELKMICDLLLNGNIKFIKMKR